MATLKKEPKIRTYYKPSGKEEELLDMSYTRYYAMKDSPQRTDIVKEWDAGEKAWDQYVSEDKNMEDWQATYFVPLTTAVVESTVSEMVDQSPRPIILPRSPEDIPKATVMKHAFDFTWEIGNGDDELEQVLKDSLIYGDGFAQEYYYTDRRVIKTLKNISKNKKGQRIEDYSEKDVYEYKDCLLESVSPYELFFDETARTINRGPYKARDAIRRYVMKLEDAKLFFTGDVWDPLGNMRFVRAGGDTSWYSFFKPPEDINHKDEVEVLWYWSRKPEDWLLVMINDVLIKAGPNPYKHKMLPFAKTSDTPRPHKFYAKGEPKLLDSIQRELNTIRRMITDRNHLDIDKMWLVSRSETYSEEDTITRPHGIIRVDDPSNYKPLEYNDIPNSVSVTLEELNKDAVRVTGVEERFQAVKTPGTATEAAMLQESVQRRIRAKLRRLENIFLVDVGRMRVANIVQFYSQPTLEKIVGEAGSKEYEAKIDEARRKGLLVTQGKEKFREQYKTIRLRDKELVSDQTGVITERPIRGVSFFEMVPSSFIPTSELGYDIRFEAGSTMPVSKPLMVKQAQDVATMLMPLASAGVGYDPVKLADWVLETMDKDPSTLKAEVVPEQGIEQARTGMAAQLASDENQELLAGRGIPLAGTPYATAIHTMTHIDFIRSPAGRQLTDPQVDTLTTHIMGEITAQDQRGSVTNSGGGMRAEQPMGMSQQALPQAGTLPQGSQPPYNQELKATMPGLVQGGEEVQGGQKGSMMSKIFNAFGGGRT